MIIKTVTFRDMETFNHISSPKDKFVVIRNAAQHLSFKPDDPDDEISIASLTDDQKLSLLEQLTQTCGWRYASFQGESLILAMFPEGPFDSRLKFKPLQTGVMTDLLELIVSRYYDKRPTFDNPVSHISSYAIEQMRWESYRGVQPQQPLTVNQVANVIAKISKPCEVYVVDNEILVLADFTNPNFTPKLLCGTTESEEALDSVRQVIK